MLYGINTGADPGTLKGWHWIILHSILYILIIRLHSAYYCSMRLSVLLENIDLFSWLCTYTSAFAPNGSSWIYTWVYCMMNSNSLLMDNCYYYNTAVKGLTSIYTHNSQGCAAPKRYCGYFISTAVLYYFSYDSLSSSLCYVHNNV